MGTGGSLRQFRLGNVEAAHKNKIIAAGRTISSLNSEVMARLRLQNRLRHDTIFMVNASLMAKPLLSTERVIRCPDWRPLQFSIFFFRRIGVGDDFAGGENRWRWAPKQRPLRQPSWPNSGNLSL
jgi:hypothetical protein